MISGCLLCNNGTPHRHSEESLEMENVKCRTEIERLRAVLEAEREDPPRLNAAISHWRGRAEAAERQVTATDLQYREAAKMASILLDYIHALKRHEGSVENCQQEPCPATIEFLSKSEKRKPETQQSREREDGLHDNLC